MRHQNLYLFSRRFHSSTIVGSNRDATAVRVRFAPSPTGYLHIGGLRTAFYNYVFARKNAGKFILRIEDTDRERIVPGSVQAIEDTLEWANLVPDEGPTIGGTYGPYCQSDRLHLYRAYVDQLLATNKAYKCFCSPTRLELLRKFQMRNREKPRYDGKCRNLSEKVVQEKLEESGGAHVVRFRLIPGRVTFDDGIFGEVASEFVEGMETDPVIMKSDGYPTYHFANVVDDHLMEISHVLRGSEWISSTAKHVQLYEALNWRQPEYMHFPLITMRDGSKMSKRNNQTQVQALRESGFRPRALLNFLTNMGGGVPKEKQDALELWNIERIISEFDFGSINCNNSSIDIEKLTTYNLKDLEKCWSEDPTKLVQEVKQLLSARNIGTDVDDETLCKIVSRFIGRMSTLHELVAPRNAFLWRLPDLKQDLKEYPDWRPVIEKVITTIEESDIDDWRAIDDRLKAIASSQGKDWRKLMRLLRILITNENIGLPVHEIFSCLGKRRLLIYLRSRLECI